MNIKCVPFSVHHDEGEVVGLVGAEESRELGMELQATRLVAKLMIAIQKKVSNNPREGEVEEEGEGEGEELSQPLLVNKFFYYSYKSERNILVEYF